MTAAAKKPARSANKAPARHKLDDGTQARRATPTPAPNPPGTARKATDTEGNVQDISGDSNVGNLPQLGVDPRTVDGREADGAAEVLPGGAYVDPNGGLHAAPPTPTRETAATANDEPGAGSSTGDAGFARKQLLSTGETVEVEPLPSAFVMTDGAGETRYEKGATEVKAEHLDHWYAKANGVRRKGK